MAKVYCRAPWVSMTYMPGGKYAPCCQWKGNFFDSREEIVDKVGGKFLNGEIPEECREICQPDNHEAWRFKFDEYDTDYKENVIHFLDFRNNNLCNLKCRSCGPLFSSSWSSESRREIIHNYTTTNLDQLDLKNCNFVYFAGGEPMMNPQHYEVLELLIKQNAKPILIYSSNFTATGYKDKEVKDLWKHFKKIQLHASIDAVGKYAEIVRSGTDWSVVESNLAWAKQQPNVHLKIAPVISAINVWWLQDLFEYFDWVDVQNFFPVLALGVIGLDVIPVKYRPDLVKVLEQSKFKEKYSIQLAVKTLQSESVSPHWYQFLTQQLVLDNYRKEHWFDNVPIRHSIYIDALQLNPWIKNE